jgi:hypothetical protein
MQVVAMESDILAAQALHRSLNRHQTREERRQRLRGEAAPVRRSGVTPRSIRMEGQLCPSRSLLHLL